MKVCMLLTNPFTHDTRVYKEAKTLVTNGYKVTVLAKYEKGLRIKENLEGINIVRIRKNLPTHILSKFEFSLKLIIKAIKENANVYHAHDLSTLFEAYIASRVNKKKLIYDSHEIAIRSYKSSFIKKLKIFIWSLIEKKLIQKADIIITVNEFIAKFLKHKYKLKNIPFIILNCYKFEKIIKKDILRKKFNLLKKDKLILYRAHIRSDLGLEQLIYAMKYLPKNFKLVVLGRYDNENYKKYIISLIQKPNVKNRIFIHDIAPLSELLLYVKCADILVIPTANIDMNNYYSSPNKIFEAIIAKIPIVASDLPFLKKIINEEKIGITFSFKSKNPEIISRSILDCFKARNYVKFKKNLEKARLKYNWKCEEKKLLEIYNKLTTDTK